MKHYHKKTVVHEFVFHFGHNKACYYCPGRSGEVLYSHLCLQRLA